MIRPEQVWLAVEPVDMRGGIDRLSQRIQNLLGNSPCDGSAYAFRNRRSTRLKLLIGTAPAYGSAIDDCIAGTSSGRPLKRVP